MEEVVGGSITEGLGGAAAIVLAILGLIGIFPVPLASIAVIALGLSLLVGGGTLAAQYSRLLSRTAPGYAAQVVGGGMTLEALCGLAGTVLGILALLHFRPEALLGAAVLVYGGALLLASMSTARLVEMRGRAVGDLPGEHEWSRDAVYAASGSDLLIGGAAVVLGILALSGFTPMTLILVALLCLGASVLLSGLSIAGRMFTTLPHAAAH
jgi:hypothetical protein